MSGQPKVAVFSFFCLYGCPPCNAFKGNPPGTATDVPANPEGPWEKLTADRDLIDAGVEFILFKFGTRRDPDGTTETFELPPVYKKKVLSAPYLELRLPNDTANGTRYEGNRDLTTVKTWILDQLKSDPYKSYRQSVKQGRSQAYTTASIKKDMMAIVNAEDVTVKQPARRVEQAPVQTQQQVRVQPTHHTHQVRVQPTQQQQPTHHTQQVRVQPAHHTQQVRVQPTQQQQPARGQPTVQQQQHVVRPRIQVQQPQEEVQEQNDYEEDEEEAQQQNDYEGEDDYQEEVQQPSYRGEHGSNQVTARGMATNPYGVPTPIQTAQVQYRSAQPVQQQQPSYRSAPQQSYQQQQTFQPPQQESQQPEQQTPAANAARVEKRAPRFKPSNYE